MKKIYMTNIHITRKNIIIKEYKFNMELPKY